MKVKFKNLFLEPYRIFFGLGSIYAILSIGIWFAWFFSLDHGTDVLSWSLNPLRVHAHVMIYGVIGFYVFGFLLTAFPRFVNQPLPSKGEVLGLSMALALSQIFLILAAFVQKGWLAVAGSLEVLSYASLWGILFQKYRQEGKFLENKQPAFLLIALLFGIIGSALFYLDFLFPGSGALYPLSLENGTYLFLLLLVVSITYRIVPFFTGKVFVGYTPRRGLYTLEIVLVLLALRLLGTLSIQDLPGRNYFLCSLNLILLFVLGREWRGWLPPRIREKPILIVLYVGLAWILVSLAFAAFEIVRQAFMAPPYSFPLYAVPALHALYVGAFGTLLLGISTRVVRGHGGLPIKADPWMLASLLLIQAAALLRVFLPILGSFWPSLAGKGYWGGPFWSAAFLVWSVRHLPWLFRAPVPEAEDNGPLPLPVPS